MAGNVVEVDPEVDEREVMTDQEVIIDTVVKVQIMGEGAVEVVQEVDEGVVETDQEVKIDAIVKVQIVEEGVVKVYQELDRGVVVTDLKLKLDLVTGILHMFLLTRRATKDVVEVRLVAAEKNL